MPQCVSSIFQQNPIVLGDLLGEVGEEGNIEPPQAPLGPGGVDPGQVGVLGVHRTGHHLSVDASELFHTVTEGNDLSGTHKGTVRRKWEGSGEVGGVRDCQEVKRKGEEGRDMYSLRLYRNARYVGVVGGCVGSNIVTLKAEPRAT